MKEEATEMFKLSEDGKTLLGVESGCWAMIEVPDGVRVIGDGAFEGKEWIESVFLPNSVEKIGEEAFSGCKNLSYISFPDDLFVIGRAAFKSCKSLHSIRLPDNLCEIGELAFDWSGLYEVTIPSSVVQIGESAFFRCLRLREVVFEGRPAKLGGWLFDSCRKLSKAVIPSGFGENTFAFSNVVDIEIVEGSEAIANREFVGLEHLKYVSVPDTVKTIGAEAFANCSQMEEFQFPTALVNIGDAAFSGCEMLQEAKFCTGLRTIGKESFANCYALDDVYIPEGVLSIGENAFHGCSMRRSLRLPQEPVSIAHLAFSNIGAVTTNSGHLIVDGWLLALAPFCDSIVVLPDGVTRIPCLDGFVGVKTLIVPASVEFVEDKAFSEFQDLEQVIFLGRPPLMGGRTGSLVGSGECGGQFLHIYNTPWNHCIREGKWRGLVFLR